VTETLFEFMARVRAEREAFVAKVTRSMRETGSFLAPMRHGSGWVTLFRSTRPNVSWQVTFWEGNPATDESAAPTGHIDVHGTVDDAAREMIGLVRR